MSLHKEFDLDPSLTYLNSGTHSICPRSVTQAWIRHLQEYEKNPTASLFNAWGRLWDIQTEVAKFFGADPKDLILRSNITQVMNLFILGLEIPKGSEILLTDLEYGAVENICRFRAERDGLKLRKVHLPSHAQEYEGLPPQSLAQKLAAEIRPETKIFVVSHVMTGNGLVLPLAELARETRKKGVMLIVDGAHAPGSLPLNLSALEDVDFYGGNLHKWMLAPKGTSFGWVPKRNQAKLQLQAAGWTTFEIQTPFDRFAEKNKFTNQHLMVGCYDFAPFFALHETFAFWNDHQPQKIFSRIQQLQYFAEDLVAKKLGWELASPPRGPFRGPLLAFHLPQALAQMGWNLMGDLFLKHQIQLATPKIHDTHVLRFSPHIHNTEADIEKAVSILHKMTG
ncbi:aminotransferase class V-fold PLP-dependent enzyme [bacterium]|nr:aminotransferase class V-fold PLP-dependent enzyme [bacterium]